MTTAISARPGRARGNRARGTAGIVLAILLSVSTFSAAVLTWTDHYVFDAKRFAARADQILDVPEVRAVLADQITIAVINAGSSEVASFRAVIKPAVELVIGTPVFRRIFRNALAEAHTYLFTEQGNAVVVNMSQAFGILVASLQLSNSSVASLLPESTDTLLVELGTTIRGMELWRIGERVTNLDWLA
ncbi:MAG: hypothetical protein ACKOE2_12345, partial [Actinomycetales bacterium]